MIVASDLEWNKRGIDVLGLAWDDGRKCTAIDRNPQTLADYMNILRKADVVVGQSYLDADCVQMASEGIDVSWLEPKVYDVRLAMHAVNSHLAGTGSFDLRSMVLLLNGRQGQRMPLDWKKYESDLHATCAFDSAAAAWIYPTLDRAVKSGKLERTVVISHQCSPIFAKMRTQGVRLDSDVLKRIYDARKAKTEATIERYHLWETRGKKVLKKVPIWRSDKVLDIFQEQFGIRPKDRQRKTWVKLQGDASLSPDAKAFVDAIIDLGRGANDAHWLGDAEETDDGIDFSKVGGDGFIHPRYDLCGSPDRAIAASPNIQNFPRPGDDPRPVPLRSAVVPLCPDHVILGIDFSSVETITNAIESNDWDRARDTLSKKISHEGTAAMINKMFGLHLNRNQGKVINHSADKGECVTPDTLILKADLTWVCAAALNEGDELVGFDEQFHGIQSKYRRTIVQKISRVVNPCYTVETDKGHMTASAKHAWLVRNVEHAYTWGTTDTLKVGQQLKFFGRSWATETSYDAGCLAGFFDGEGCVSNNGISSTVLQVNQNVGTALDRYRELLTCFGYAIREKHRTHKNSQKLHVVISMKSRYDAMRFLGSVRPVRLLAKAHRFWENVSVTGGHHEQPATIIRITPVGDMETIAIKTSTQTLVTNGFLTHNSPYNLARNIFKTDRPSRQQVLQCHNIFTTMLSAYPKTNKFRDDLWEAARDNPLVVTNSFGRRLMCFSRSKYGDSGDGFRAAHNPAKKYWCSCAECSPRRDRWKYAIAFLGRSSAFDALLRKMAVIYHERRLDEYSLPIIECHDELCFSVPQDKAVRYADIVKRTFEEPIEELGNVSLPANAVIGDSWASAH